LTALTWANREKCEIRYEESYKHSYKFRANYLSKANNYTAIVRKFDVMRNKFKVDRICSEALKSNQTVIIMYFKLFVRLCNSAMASNKVNTTKERKKQIHREVRENKATSTFNCWIYKDHMYEYIYVYKFICINLIHSGLM
jgi:hypothetical protein